MEGWEKYGEWYNLGNKYIVVEGIQEFLKALAMRRLCLQIFGI
jgi:hypothetical protein